MKKLKKFAALLLVGVMALALLTACGGGDSPLKEGAFPGGKAPGSGAKLPVSPEPPSLREVANPQGLTEGVRPAPGLFCVWGQLPKRRAEFGRSAC